MRSYINNLNQNQLLFNFINYAILNIKPGRAMSFPFLSKGLVPKTSNLSYSIRATNQYDIFPFSYRLSASQGSDSNRSDIIPAPNVRNGLRQCWSEATGLCQLDCVVGTRYI